MSVEKDPNEGLYLLFFLLWIISVIFNNVPLAIGAVGFFICSSIDQKKGGCDER